MITQALATILIIRIREEAGTLAVKYWLSSQPLLALNTSSTTQLLCDLGQVTLPLGV